MLKVKLYFMDGSAANHTCEDAHHCKDGTLQLDGCVDEDGLSIIYPVHTIKKVMFDVEEDD